MRFPQRVHPATGTADSGDVTAAGEDDEFDMVITEGDSLTAAEGGKGEFGGHDDLAEFGDYGAEDGVIAAKQ